MNRREILGGGLALSASALTPLPAFAQAKYPDRPIRLVVPFCAGGVVDAVARQWAERMKPHARHRRDREPRRRRRHHRHGRSGARGSPTAIRSRSATPRRWCSIRRSCRRCRTTPAQDFEPISILAVSASGIIVHPRVPAKNLKEFIAYAKANQDKISYGSAGAGTMTNFAGELFKQLIGAPKIVHVPYKGAGPSITDQVGGAIPMSTINITGQLLALHNSGKVRVLAVTVDRSPEGRARNSRPRSRPACRA